MTDLDHLKQKLEKHMQHSYIEKFINKPVIDEDKLALLSAIIQNTSIPTHKQNNYIITTMLVQIALDTHDLVTKSETKDESDTNKKARQLTVLAGDYYSGLYYHLLSQIEDIAMIKILASAIKEINELKMLIYYKQFDSVEEFFRVWSQQDSLLILKVAEHLDQPSVVNFVKNWLLYKRLVLEKKELMKAKNSSIRELLKNIVNKNGQGKQVSEVLDEVIDKQAKEVDELIMQLPKQFDSFSQYCEQMITIKKQKMVAEEG